MVTDYGEKPALREHVCRRRATRRLTHTNLCVLIAQAIGMDDRQVRPFRRMAISAVVHHLAAGPQLLEFEGAGQTTQRRGVTTCRKLTSTHRSGAPSSVCRQYLRIAYVSHRFLGFFSATAMANLSVLIRVPPSYSTTIFPDMLGGRFPRLGLLVKGCDD